MNKTEPEKTGRQLSPARSALLQRGFALLAMLVLAGCTLLPPATSSTGETEQPVPQQNLLSPLEYYAWVQQAPGNEIEAEHARLTRDTSSSNSYTGTVQLSMLLSFAANATAESETEAAALLQQATEGSSATVVNRDYEIFADVLLAHLEQKQALRLAGTENAEQMETIKQLEAGTRQLQEQIKALTSIEQQIIEREQQQKLELDPIGTQLDQGPEL